MRVTVYVTAEKYDGEERARRAAPKVTRFCVFALLREIFSAHGRAVV